MPKYLDHHKKMPNLPPEVVKQLQEAIKSGKPNQLGVKPLNAFIGKDGQGWCYSEAPNADAVCKTHEAIGVKLPKGDVVEVTTMA